MQIAKMLVARVLLATMLAVCLFASPRTLGSAWSGGLLQAGPLVSEPFSLVDDWFYPYVNYAAGERPYAVGIGDFNNDHLFDVAVTDAYFDVAQLYIFPQSDNGQLIPPTTTYPTVYRAESLAVGDFNDDGLDDVVVGGPCKDDHCIGVFLQQPDGTMAEQIALDTHGGRVSAVTVGDLNDDGRDDVAAAFYLGPSHFGVFVQDASGSLRDMITYPTIYAGFLDLEAGDMNNDGLVDIVLMNAGRPNLLVYVQNLEGTFDPYVSYDIGPDCDFCSSEDIRVGDVTGDGLDDVVVSYVHPYAKIAVFGQNAGGTLDAPRIYDAFDGAATVNIGDISMDGRNDVVVVHERWKAVSVYLQHEIGLLLPYETYPIPNNGEYGPQSITVGDVNGDGRPDVVLADSMDVDSPGFTGLIVLPHSVPDFYMDVLPIYAEAARTETVTYTVSLAGLYNFTETVSLTLANLPPEASHTVPVTPVSVPGSLEFTVQLGSTEPTRTVTYSLTLIGKSSALTRTASTELLLHAPDFAIGLTPGVGYVEPGGTITYTAILTSLYHFAEPITLGASISPGATVELPVGPVFAPGSVELGVQVDADMPARAASYPLEVVGHSASLTRTAAAELYVLNRSFLPVVIAD